MMSSSWTTTTKRFDVAKDRPRRYSIHWRLGQRLAREAYDAIAERPSVDVLVNNLGICEAVGFFGLTSGIAT
jgi:hypothetical protein